jgi:hypothetical protein
MRKKKIAVVGGNTLKGIRKLSQNQAFKMSARARKHLKLKKW